MDLGGLPTPVSHQQALGERLGLPALYVKHDDRAGEVYGGSKARKLEHLLADALARGARSVLTYGGMGSNHALATAVHTDRLGLGCQLLLLAEPPSDHAREHLLAEHHLGCEQHRAGGIDEDAARRALGPRFDAERPYIIPAGGTSPLGNAGYVNAAFELAAQCDAGELPIPEVIYVALGTTGTAAGLYVGLRAAGLPTRVVAVRASNPGTGSLRNLSATIESTARFLNELDPSFPRVEADRELLRLEHGFAGAGYAIPSDDGRRAAELARTLGALELDPTYTSKAFAALIHDAPRLSGQPVLFWNTYDPRHIPWGEARPEDLPPAFLPYLRNPEG
jgi:D-cysteine desulfhydrase